MAQFFKLAEAIYSVVRYSRLKSTANFFPSKKYQNEVLTLDNDPDLKQK